MVQWTVSYAPCGRPLRDINARTKVIARDIMYRKPAGKRDKEITVSRSESVKSARKPTKIAMKGIKMEIGRAHV